jgi:tetratricopeptide (TPR) repeat protein
MMMIRIQYDAFNRTFKLVDSEFRTLLEGDARSTDQSFAQLDDENNPMTNIKRVGVKIVWIGLKGQGAFLLMTFVLMLMTSTTGAGQSESHVVAKELQRRGDLVGAEKTLQRALKEAKAAGNSVKVAGALAVLGAFYQDIGRFSQAESSFRGSLKIVRENTSQDDPAIAPLIIHLAWLYVETGRAGEALRLDLESWVDRLTLFEPESKYLPMLLETLGGLHALQGRFAEARNIYHRNFSLLASRGAHVSVEMASALNNFAFIQLRAHRYTEARNDFSKALRLWMDLTGPDDLQVAVSRLGLAEAHMALGQYDASSELLQQALPVFEQRCGPDSLRTEDVLTRYAMVLRRQGRKEEANKLEERARRIRQASATELSFKHVINVWDVGNGAVAAPENPLIQPERGIPSTRQ